MVFTFIFIVCLGYLIYLKGGYTVDMSLKEEEKIYKIKDKEKEKDTLE